MRSLEEIELLEIETDKDYQEYYNKLLSYLRETTLENSITFEFKIEKNNCLCKVEKYEIDGSHQIIENKRFSEVEKVIKIIIKPLLSSFSKQNKIIIHTISPNHGNKSNLKIITEKNDMCNIINLEDKKIMELSEQIDHEKKNTQKLSQQKMDEHGVGNALAFILCLVIVGMIFLGMISNLWK